MRPSALQRLPEGVHRPPMSVDGDPEKLALRIAGVVADRKALDIIAIDVRGLSSYTDFLVICSGTSDKHVQSVADTALTTLDKEDDIRAGGSEGQGSSRWALVDFGAVILHVFHQFSREIYDLEELWKDAPRLALPTDFPNDTTDQRSASGG